MNSNSDTKLKGGAASWLRTFPTIPMFKSVAAHSERPIQMESSSLSRTKSKWTSRDLSLHRPRSSSGSVLSILANHTIGVSRPRRQTSHDGFIRHADTWDNTILYKADVSYIALTQENLPDLQTGSFSTADVRGPGWFNANSGCAKLGKAFVTGPRVGAGLNMF